jgi:predicted PurR-regulated permease PerM
MGRFEHMRDNIRRAYEAGRASVRAAKAEQAKRYEEATLIEDLPAAAEEIHHSTTSRDDAEVPVGLRVAGAWGWRLIIIIVLAGFFVWALVQLADVVVPIVIAVLLAALFSPAVTRLRSLGLNKSLATAIVVVAGIATVVGTLTLVVGAFVDGLPDVTKNVSKGLSDAQTWLKGEPFNLSDVELKKFGDSLGDWLNANTGTLTTGVIAGATTALHVLTAIFLVLFSLFFLLRDGRQIWRFLLSLLPNRTREPLDYAGNTAWRTLVSYVRATVFVAFIDAIGIGIAMAVLGLPANMVWPLATLVFLFAFIPILGATLSGAIAVLVMFAVTQSFFKALVLLAAVIAVQQLEGHVLQPFIMGRAVSVHPLAVILAIAAGLVLAGIFGALIAVPLVATLNTGIRALVQRRRAEIEAEVTM